MSKSNTPPQIISKAFRLSPFQFTDSERLAMHIDIDGTIKIQESLLTLHFNLADIDSSIHWPANNGPKTRSDELWKHTCLECFIKHPDQSAYWELNCSPAGAWNCYYFDSYRTGMQEESALAQCDIFFQKKPSGASCEALINLGAVALGAPLHEFRFGITAVIELNNGEILYYALYHAAPKPDFHRPESFVLDFCDSKSYK